jgi:hypothetical protein
MSGLARSIRRNLLRSFVRSEIRFTSSLHSSLKNGSGADKHVEGGKSFYLRGEMLGRLEHEVNDARRRTTCYSEAEPREELEKSVH